MEYPRPLKNLVCVVSLIGPFFFLVLSCFSIVTASSNAAAGYDPSYNIALDCGSSGNSTASDGRVWAGDIGSKLATVQPLDTTVAASPIRQGPVVGAPYFTARLSSSRFTYTFPVNAGPKFVRLYFYPSWYPGFDRSKASFSVKSGPSTLLNNFRPDLAADASGVGYFVREFCINVEEGDQLLNLIFTPSPSPSHGSYAFVNGIEIVSTPPNLYYTPAGDLGVPFVGQKSFYDIESINSLETMFRLDVGGQSVRPTGDSGMFRFWSNDNDFFTGGGFVPDRANNTIKYSKETPAYIAPAEVYQTCRSMGPNKMWNKRHNLTWILPVDLGFKYLIRLHFCETDPAITHVSDRQFIVYINGEMVEEAADAISWSGGNSIPVYRDYLAMIGFEGTQGKYNLSIDLHSRSAYTVYTDAVLNGIEIFKLNNTNGSLAGPYPEPPKTIIYPTAPSQGTSKASSYKRASYIAVGVVVMIVLVLLSWRLYAMYRPQRKVKDYDYDLKFTEIKALPLP